LRAVACRNRHCAHIYAYSISAFARLHATHSTHASTCPLSFPPRVCYTTVYAHAFAGDIPWDRKGVAHACHFRYGILTYSTAATALTSRDSCRPPHRANSTRRLWRHNKPRLCWTCPTYRSAALRTISRVPLDRCGFTSGRTCLLPIPRTTFMMNLIMATPHASPHKHWFTLTCIGQKKPPLPLCILCTAPTLPHYAGFSPRRPIPASSLGETSFARLRPTVWALVGRMLVSHSPSEGGRTLCHSSFCMLFTWPLPLPASLPSLFSVLWDRRAARPTYLHWCRAWRFHSTTYILNSPTYITPFRKGLVCST